MRARQRRRPRALSTPCDACVGQYALPQASLSSIAVHGFVGSRYCPSLRRSTVARRRWTTEDGAARRVEVVTLVCAFPFIVWPCRFRVRVGARCDGYADVEPTAACKSIPNEIAETLLVPGLSCETSGLSRSTGLPIVAMWLPLSSSTRQSIGRPRTCSIEGGQRGAGGVRAARVRRHGLAELGLGDKECLHRLTFIGNRLHGRRPPTQLVLRRVRIKGFVGGLT